MSRERAMLTKDYLILQYIAYYLFSWTFGRSSSVVDYGSVMRSTEFRIDYSVQTELF